MADLRMTTRMQPWIEKAMAPPPPKDRLSTQDLARLAASGDRGANDALARRVWSSMLRAARRGLRHGFPGVRKLADTDDLAQSAYHDALRALPSWEPRERGTFRGWLLGVLRNKLRRRRAHYLAARRDARREVPLPVTGVAGVAVAAPHDLVIRGEDRERLERALERIAPDHRAVLRLRYFEACPWSDVAARLGRTEEAAQMLCHRALACLRRAFVGATEGSSSGDSR
jgi:RNA polymerase sigma-70 factor (ECF subfamily)